MFLPLFIAIFLGLACPSSTVDTNQNTIVTTNDAGAPGADDGTNTGPGTGGGTGTGGSNGTGGDTGQLPPPKP
jgi:hypothetical protein